MNGDWRLGIKELKIGDQELGDWDQGEINLYTSRYITELYFK